MIANVKAVSHGFNVVNYITGESATKKHPEKIFHVHDRFMPEGLSASGIWESMKLSVAKYPRHVDNSVFRIEISPAAEHTADFTQNDWRQLWDDFMCEFDRQEFRKKGKLTSGKTHFADSKQTVWVHFESKSSIPHLHAVVCRVDENGRINNDHDVHLRAQHAAEQVALSRGWKLASTIHEERRPQISNDCYKALKSMRHFDLMDYFHRLERMGYQVKANTPDENGIIHGYSVNINGCRYKGSELGKGRDLTVTNLPKTWQKLQNQMKQDELTNEARAKAQLVGTLPCKEEEADRQRSSLQQTNVSPRPVMRPQAIPEQQPVQEPQYIPAYSYRDYYHPFDDSSRYNFHDSETHEDVSLFIPSEVKDILDKEFDYTEVFNWRQLTDMAVQLFVGYLDAATSMQPSGGGGGGNETGWGRKKDEGDLEFARRCAQSARRSLGVKPKLRIKR